MSVFGKKTFKGGIFDKHITKLPIYLLKSLLEKMHIQIYHFKM